MQVCGLILAGGKARRFGQDKRFADLGGKPLINHAIGRLKAQVDRLVLSSNDSISGWPDITQLADQQPAQGPLLGIAEGLAFAWDEGFDWLITAPADSPFLPEDLAKKLLSRRSPGSICFAESGGRRHPVFGAWPTAKVTDLFATIAGGVRRIDRAAQSIAKVETQEWSVAGASGDPFFNINRHEDLVRAARIYAANRASS